MSNLKHSIAHAELAFALIRRVRNTASRALMDEFASKIDLVIQSPRLKGDMSITSSINLIEWVRDLDKESPDEAISEIVKNGHLGDPSLQGDLCDAVVNIGDLYALALEVSDDLGEPVEYFRGQLTTDFGAARKAALQAHGGPLAELLLTQEDLSR